MDDEPIVVGVAGYLDDEAKAEHLRQGIIETAKREKDAGFERLKGKKSVWIVRFYKDGRTYDGIETSDLEKAHKEAERHMKKPGVEIAYVDREE